MNEVFDIMREDINIFHYIFRTTNDAKIIAKKFLRPTSKLMNTSGVF